MLQRVDGQGCTDILNRLDAWIDGDLGESEAALVEAHIDRCASCRAARQVAEEMVVELRSLPDFKVPERVLRAVRTRVRPTLWEKLKDILDGSMQRPVTAGAVLAVVVLVVVTVSPWRDRSALQYTDQEIERATEETKLALAYVGSITRRAELRVKKKIFDDGVAAQTVSGVRRSLKIIGGAAAATADLPATPLPNVKGS
jgi:hypothetical protein